MTHADPAAAIAPAPTGRRERKKAATDAALREAAQQLVARHGVENVTIEQIAAGADIAVRTFFNYFASKEEVLLAPLAAGAEAFIAEFRARPASESVLAALREAALRVLHTGAVGREPADALRQIVQAPSLGPRMLAIFAAQEEALAAAIADRVRTSPQPDRAAPGARYPVLCAAVALTALRLVLKDWLETPRGSGGIPPRAALQKQIDEVIADLATGFDWPGRAAHSPR